MLKRLILVAFLFSVVLADNNGSLFDGDPDSKFNEMVPTGSGRLKMGSEESPPVNNGSLNSNETVPTLDSNETVINGKLISGSNLSSPEPNVNNNHSTVYLEPKDLYSFENSPVWELNAKRLEILIKNKRAQASVVQFYSSASKMSKDYVAVYLQATNRPFIWTDFLRFYAVNCKQEENVRICKKYGFKHAPLIRYFSAGSSESDPGTKVNTYTKSTHLLTQILRHLNTDYANGKCPFCDRLQFYKNDVETLEDVWTLMSKRCYRFQHLLIPVESLDDPDGIDRYYQIVKALFEVYDQEKSLLSSRTSVIENKVQHVYFPLSLNRIPKSHPLFRNASSKINDWELIMLTRQSDEWYDDHKDLSGLQLIGQIPVNSHESTSKKCSGPRHDEYKMVNFSNIVSRLNDTGAKNKTESALIGPFFVQHYF
ncbi:Sulfhydryl oxidase 2-like isoform X2 [Aphelenchoides bicaudatus]|nr:Sulfhydryl oxidase 2-like isoform X2 [Aphelenchoides bicaudatus]